MPAKLDLTWEPTNRRWLKSYKGRCYKVSARQLGCPETKEGSYVAANAWWDAKRKDLDGAADLDQQEQRLTAHRDYLIGERSKVQAARRALLGQPDPTAKTLRQRFLEWIKGTELRGKIDPARLIAAKDHKRRVEPFIRWTEANNVADIDGQTLEAYFGHLLELPTAPATKRAVWNNVAQFVQYCTEQGTARPANFRSSRFKIKLGRKKPETWTVAQVRAALDAADERLRLYLFLMVQCGMYQADLTNLLKEEIDLDAGTLTYGRRKNEKHDDQIRPTYQLWPETLDLLRRHLSDHPTLALTTERGTPLTQTVPTRYDTIHQRYLRLCGKLGWTARPELSDLRKTAANILDHKCGVAARKYYLARSPKGVDEQFYIVPRPGEFAAHLLTLRKELGIGAT